MDIEFGMLVDRMAGVDPRDAQFRREWQEIQEVERLERELQEAKRKVDLLPRRFARES